MVCALVTNGLALVDDIPEKRLALVMLSSKQGGGLPTVTRSLAVLILMVWAVLLLHQGPVQANGATRLVLENERAGPYQLQVGILPGSPKVGNLHLSIEIDDAASGASVADALVWVTATGPEGSTNTGPVQASRLLTSGQSYEVNISLDTEGSWLVTIDVDAAQGEVSLDIPLEVTAGGISLALVAAVAVAFLAASIWSWDRIKGRRKRQELKG